MKLTEEQKQELLATVPDNESFHMTYDYMIKKRLSELDPEFLEEIEKIDALIETGKRLSDFELKELAKYYRAEARKLIKIKGLV